MDVGNYSADASVIENGKLIKGTLTLFKDEYVFADKRTDIQWENTVCEQGTETIKSFLRTISKPYVAFKNGEKSSPRFILEPEQIKELVNKVENYAASIRNEREEKERKIAEEKRRQLERESRLREDARLKAEKEYQEKKEKEQQRKAEINKNNLEIHNNRVAEKKARMKREIEACKNREAQVVSPAPISKKAASFFLDNPFRTLGVSCLVTNEEANSALDKLKKLARLKALDSYRSPYDLSGLEKPKRDLSLAQNALVLLKNKVYKFFWFADSDACVAWQSGKYRIELVKDGEEYGTYDLFLANYLYALLNDPDFNTAETWKRILNYYCFICEQQNCELLRSRFSEKELQDISNTDLLTTFRANIFKPIIQLCERDDLDAVIRLHKCIKDCGRRQLDGLSKRVLGKLVSWFTDKEAAMFAYLSEVDSEESISAEKGAEIKARGEDYCRIVEPVFQTVLRDFRGDRVRYDMIKESYRHTTYQFMYELNKCADKTDAILFANKCYGYCNADDKKRIQFTFGEANIKSVDWNVPHTGWDSKGDDYYFGRGCPVDYSQALYWYHKAAEAGNMYSPNSIGLCYQNGYGVPQSDEIAASWFEKAYNAGNPQGAYNLAECYFAGKGVAKSIDLALKYWTEATKLGHPSASHRRDEVFSIVQGERRQLRAKNHVCHDLGFQMTTGPVLAAEVMINKSAYAYLVNAQNYHSYLSGNDFKFYGGYASSSPYKIIIPSSNHWYVIIDNGGDPVTGIVSSVKVRKA